jgi:exopolyphosphatase / guanosine-5'-triphosphate,3'-diphosphate pyrophosphatase
MRIGVIDAGANTLRLLVMREKRGELSTMAEERVRLGMGEEIEQFGRLSEAKLAELAVEAAVQAERARALRCERIEVLLTSPGRQSDDPAAIVETLERATRASVRMLSGEEEAVLGYLGAVGACTKLPESVAVCDVGGGSSQVVVGTHDGGVAWARSFDIGSLRLTRRTLGGDPPSASALEAARTEAERGLNWLTPPAAKAALAVGGSARAVAKIVGTELGPDELERAIELLSSRRRIDVATRFRMAPQRAETVLAGTIILAEVQRRLAVSFRLGTGGVREGAVRELLAERLAA